MAADASYSDPAAWPHSTEALFQCLEGPLLRYATRLGACRDGAQDVVQEAFLRFHRFRGEVLEPRPWLFRTVHNLVLNDRRTQGRMVSSSKEGGETQVEGAFLESDPMPDQVIAHQEALGLLRLSLETLDARSRELVRLKFEERLSYREIGDRLGLTPSHVGYLLHHTIKSLADELAKTDLCP